MFIPSGGVVKRVLNLYIAGTRGGPVRLRMLMLLDKKPRNINEISKELSMDYKTIQHHIRVLEKSCLIQSSGKKYGNAYELSELLKANRKALSAVAKNMGKSK